MNLTLSLSLFSLFLISSLLLHNSLSLSSHLSVMVGIFWHGSGMGCSSSPMMGCDFSPMMGCLSLMTMGWVLCVWCDGGGVDLVVALIWWQRCDV